jgi:hypothetical protein
MAIQGATDKWDRTIAWDDAADPVEFAVSNPDGTHVMLVQRAAGTTLAMVLDTIECLAPPQPDPPAAPPTVITPLDFIRRFTLAEQTTLIAANPLWGIMIAAAGTIFVEDPMLQADLAQAVAAGLLTSARMAQVPDLTQASP